MYTYTCPTCGKIFQSPHKNRKTCSYACRQLPGAPHQFTQKQEIEICQLYSTPNKTGHYMGAGQIAKRFESNARTIHNILDRHKVAKRTKTFYVQNQPHHALCRIPPKNEKPPLCRCGCGLATYWLQKNNRWAIYAKGHCPQSTGDGNGKLPYPKGWSTANRKARQRDNWTCQECGYYGKDKKGILHVHHIDRNKANNDLSNLVTLCIDCHYKTHQQTPPNK